MRKKRLLLAFVLLQMQLMPREIWVHPLNAERVEKGEFYTLYPDLRHYPKKFFKIYRMNIYKFDNLLERIGPRLMEGETNYRASISAEQQLVLTLRFVLSC